MCDVCNYNNVQVGISVQGDLVCHGIVHSACVITAHHTTSMHYVIEITTTTRGMHSVVCGDSSVWLCRSANYEESLPERVFCR